IWSQPAQIIVITNLRNLSVVDQDRAIGPPAQRAELGRIDEEAAEAEQASIALHKRRVLSNHFGRARRNIAVVSRIWRKKKDSGSARQGETANTRNVQLPESP